MSICRTLTQTTLANYLSYYEQHGGEDGGELVHDAEVVGFGSGELMIPGGHLSPIYIRGESRVSTPAPDTFPSTRKNQTRCSVGRIVCTRHQIRPGNELPFFFLFFF